MFDVEAKQDLAVCQFYVDLFRDRTTTSHPITIFTKSGTHGGFETNQSAWNFVESFQPQESAGSNLPTRLPVMLNQPMVTGERRAFYIFRDDATATPTLGAGTDQFVAPGQSNGVQNGLEVFSGTILDRPFADEVPGFGPIPDIVIRLAPDTSTCPQALPVVQLPTDVFDGPGGGGPLVAGNVYQMTPSLGQARVPAGQTLTVEEGAILQFGVTVGTASTLRVDGTLIATSAAFTSMLDTRLGGDTSGQTTPPGVAPGDWRGIAIVAAMGKVLLDSCTQWNGQIVHCNVWNNAPNYCGFDGSELFFCNGGFAGLNGCVDDDPRFESGDTTLRSTSPLIDAGDRNFNHHSLQLDARGFPRYLYGFVDPFTGEFVPDIGAHEYSPGTLTRTGGKRAGERVSVSVQSTQPGFVVHVFGFGTTAFEIPGIGTLAVGNPALIIATPPLALPGTLAVGLPSTVSGYTLANQSFVFGGFGSFLSNVQRGTVGAATVQ